MKVNGYTIEKAADLRRANLERADLEGADLYNTSIKAFQFGKHFGFYHEGNIQIGCMFLPTYIWLCEFKEIGMQENYSEEEIFFYGEFIKTCAKYEGVAP